MKQVFVTSLIIILALSILTIAPSSSFAESIQYFYDDVGRLIATVSDTGDVTIYSYDEVGNLLSISKDTFTPNPPVIQSINPDILFIGTTTLVSITGQNLLTTKSISSNNPLLSISIITVTDTQLNAEIIAPPQALHGTVSLTVTTLYGSASVQATLTTSQLSFGPSLLSLTPGSSGTMMASIYPLVGKAETIQIRNSDFSIVSIPQSVTIPGNGTAAFSINASREGVAYITSGQAAATVIVTTSTFTPVSGEQLTIKGGPVSVYFDTPSNGSAQSYTSVSAYIDTAEGNSVTQAMPVSVLIDSPTGSATVISVPVSARISP